jgi:hypothetical protein
MLCVNLCIKKFKNKYVRKYKNLYKKTRYESFYIAKAMVTTILKLLSIFFIHYAGLKFSRYVCQCIEKNVVLKNSIYRFFSLKCWIHKLNNGFNYFGMCLKIPP